MMIDATGQTKLTAMYDDPQPTVAIVDFKSDPTWQVRHFKDPKPNDFESRFQYFLNDLSPAFIPPLYGGFVAFTSNSKRLSSWDNVAYYLQSNPAFIYLSVFVILSAIAATFWACRRRGLTLRQTLQWCGWTLLLGWGGLIAVLAIYTQPKFQSCPRCDKDRRIDRRTCEHCGAAWEPPASEGIEIYDDRMVTNENPVAVR